MIITYPIDNKNNYIYDDTKIQVLSGEAKLIAQVVGAEALLYFKLDEGDGLVAIDSSGNNNHGAFQGGYDENQWSTSIKKLGASALQGLTTTNGFINVDQRFEFERTEPFSLECWVKTTSTASMSIMSKQLYVSPFTGFGLNFLSGKVRLVIRDASNVLSIEYSILINDGNWHHIIMTYDGSSLITGCHLYVDNTENDTIIASTPLTGSILTSADFQVSGRDGNNNCIDSDTYIDEVLVYERALTPAEVSFRWNSGNGTQEIPGATTSYPTDNPNFESTATVKASQFNGIVATITATGSDEIRGIMKVNGVRKYWTGSQWDNSTGYSQSNTIAELNANASTLLTSVANIGAELFLHSDDGTTTPILKDWYIDFDYETTGITYTETKITGYLNDLEGDAEADQLVKVRSVWLEGTNIITTDDFISATVQTDGTWEVNLKIEDDLPNYLDWRIKTKKYRTNYLTGDIKFSDLIIIWEN